MKNIHSLFMSIAYLSCCSVACDTPQPKNQTTVKAPKQTSKAQPPRKTVPRVAVSKKKPTPPIKYEVSPDEQMETLLERIEDNRSNKSLYGKHQMVLIYQSIVNLYSSDKKQDKLYKQAIKYLAKAKRAGIIGPGVVSSCSLRQLSLTEATTPIKTICTHHLAGNPNKLKGEVLCQDKALMTVVVNSKTQARVFSYGNGDLRVYGLAVFLRDHWYTTTLEAHERSKAQGWQNTHTIHALNAAKFKTLKSPAIYLSASHTRKFHLQPPNQLLNESFRDLKYDMIISTDLIPKIIYSINTQDRFRKIVHKKLRTTRHFESGVTLQIDGKVHIKARPKSYIKPGVYEMTHLNHRCLGRRMIR